MPANPRLLEISDPELLELIKEDPDYFSIVFKNTKDYSFRFMRNMVSNSRIREEEFDDIYQDALIVLYENIVAGHFRLSSSFQTYLNSVCRNLLLKRFRGISDTVVLDDDYMERHMQSQFDPNVKDELRELEIEENSKFLALKNSLDIMKDAGGKCYEMLSLYWYHKKSIAQISDHFGYTNDVNTRNQKSKCQKRLRKMAHNELNTL
jgi:RNA polymerase sigma factor (sigma-70 family)